jgi:hypothetical protein
MKILFICGSIELGKDGVGDYTRRLSGELLRTGHEIQIISLCDKVADCFFTENQEIEETPVTVRRIPMCSNYQQRLDWTQEILTEIRPDWISLQFVPYSFNPKGLPFWLPSFLKKLKGNHKWHIMFHELWIGMELNATFKSKCIGLLQQYLVSSLFNKLDVKVINTQTNLYQSKILKLGYNAQILPLFSNIIKNKVSKSNTIGTNNELELKFCIFGSIHQGAPVEKFIDELKQVLSVLKEKKALKFFFIGYCGGAIEEWKKVLLTHKINFEITGFVTDEEISNLLTSCQYGVSTTPYILNQKSGSLAAMFDHQLPVLCIARNWIVKGFNQGMISNLINYENQESITEFINRKFIELDKNDSVSVGLKFLNGLK